MVSRREPPQTAMSADRAIAGGPPSGGLAEEILAMLEAMQARHEARLRELIAELEPPVAPLASDR